MGDYVSFAELKQKIGIEQVLDMLDIRLKGAGAQLRGPCPIHKGASDREFVVTPSKGLWFCFAGCGGGDIIALVAKVKKVGQKEAAELIARHFGTVTVPPARNGNRSPPAGTVTVPGTVPEKEKGALKPLDYLQPEHELVQALGISPETCRTWGAGYAPKGIMRGRLAIPVHDPHSTLLAYCGRAVRGESPELLFPSGFDPAPVIFGADRVEEGFIYLVKDPLDVLRAYENGIANVIAHLTAITPDWLEMLASLMDERKCPSMDFFLH
jgi:DNA primase